MDSYLIAIGSNLGDRMHNIREAQALIAARVGKILKVSSIYETLPVGNANQCFLNGALICQSLFKQPKQILKILLDIERDLGRVRETHWGNRTIDLDLILHQNSEGSFPLVQSKDLQIPHPRCTERDFVLVPACEIAGQWLLPPHQVPLSSYLPIVKIHSIQKNWGPCGPLEHSQNS